MFDTIRFTKAKPGRGRGAVKAGWINLEKSTDLFNRHEIITDSLMLHQTSDEELKHIELKT